MTIPPAHRNSPVASDAQDRDRRQSQSFEFFRVACAQNPLERRRFGRRHRRRRVGWCHLESRDFERERIRNHRQLGRRWLRRRRLHSGHRHLHGYAHLLASGSILSPCRIARAQFTSAIETSDDSESTRPAGSKPSHLILSPLAPKMNAETDLRISQARSQPRGRAT